MDGHGFIKDKLDIKFLILFILKQLDGSASFADITEMAMIDSGFGFFELSEAFYELVTSGHISENKGNPLPLYSITDSGRETSELYLSRLPASVRQAAQRTMLGVLSRSRRDAQILASTKPVADNQFSTTLSLSDGMDEIMNLKLLTLNPEQSAMIENAFRKNAEAVYNAIITALFKEN